MKAVLRYIAALLAVFALLGAAAAGLAAYMTTDDFLREVYGTQALRAQQQERIMMSAVALTEKWQLSPETLAPYTDNAAQKQAEAVAAWWHDLWNIPGADCYMPAFLNAAEERELVTAIMQDEGFRAVTEENQRRAIARDEIAYALDEAVCEAVMPLRRSIVDMAASLVSERIDLPMVRRAALIGAGALAAAGAALLILAHRLAGSALLATGSAMMLCTVPVWMMDVPGMLAQLSVIAAAEGANALAVMGVLWLGAALALVLAGGIIICIKRAVGRNGK